MSTSTSGLQDAMGSKQWWDSIAEHQKSAIENGNKRLISEITVGELRMIILEEIGKAKEDK